MAIIAPQPKSLRELIRDKHYQVPLYQRPYDWDIDHVSELWDDVSKNEAGYFLGTVLFMPKPKSEHDQHPDNFDVVDGQQRLATLLLLLRAAIEILEEHKGSTLAHDFQKEYVAQKPAGRESFTPTLILSKNDKNKFESLLLGKAFLTRPTRTSWKNLDKTIQFFREKFELLNKEQGAKGIVDFLNEKVLKLSFLDIQLGTDSDVYQFFETLNDRGKDLSIADLVKNRICAQAAKQNKSVEDVASVIDRISDDIGGGKFQSFLLHYCWANGEEDVPTPRKKLMDWYGKRINQESDVKIFLDDLEKQALQHYVNYVNPNKCADSRKKNVFTYLDALGATRCYPLILASERYLLRKDFLAVCEAIEILTFRHSTILQKDAKNLEGVFYGLIKDIKQKKPIKEIIKIIKKQDSMKIDDQFRLALNEFSPVNHKVARYVLWKIEEYITGKKQAPLDWDSLTLEHILAEKLKWVEREEYLERLGNLTLLSAPMNEEAANKPFIEKKRDHYVKEKRITITKNLAKFADFTKDEIISRQKELAEYAVKIWNNTAI